MQRLQEYWEVNGQKKKNSSNLLAFLNEQAIQLNRQQNLFAYIAKKQQ